MSGINIPEEVNLGQFTGKGHGTRSGDVIIINKRQIKITDMYYDGQAPGKIITIYVYIMII